MTHAMPSQYLVEILIPLFDRRGKRFSGEAP
jgi:hypothetical protein